MDLQGEEQVMQLHILEKRPVERPVGGLIWAALLFSVGAGYMLGALLGGWAADEGEVVRTVVGSIVGAVAVLGVGLELRSRLGSPLAPLALVVTGYGGGLLIGLGARAGADLRYSAQVTAWYGTVEAKAGLAAVVVGLVVAVLTTLRNPRQGTQYAARTGGADGVDPGVPTYPVTAILSGSERQAAGSNLVEGTLVAYPDRLELRSTTAQVTFPDVREIAYESTPGVRVTYRSDDGSSTAHFMASFTGSPRIRRKANQRLAQDLQRIYAGRPVGGTAA